MREILFRGKRVDNGERLYGNLLRTDDGTYIIQNYIPQTELSNYSVDPSTVSQYTGLKDKNGRKIFEGDILDCGDRIVFVQWHEQCGTWDSQLMRYQNELSSNGVNNVEWKFRAVVIGNLHDCEVLT